MLLLSLLFTLVSLLLIYALMRDTGANTPHARQTDIAAPKLKQPVTPKKVSEEEPHPISVS